MSNCNLKLEITGYEPKNIEPSLFNDFVCIFKLDNFEGKINIGQYISQKINHFVKNIKNDLKYMIRMINLKTNSLIGITDLIIPFSLIKSTNVLSSNEINKQCILTMLESTKHLLFGTFSKERDIKISIKVSFEVLSRNNNNLIKKNYKSQAVLKNKNLKFENIFNSKILNKYNNDFSSIKTPPSNKTKKIVDYKNEKFYTMPNNPVYNFKTSQNKNKEINKIRKEFYSTRNQNNQIFKTKLKNNSIILKEKGIYLNTSPNININKIERKYVSSMTEIIGPSIDHSKNISIVEPNLNDNYIETEDNSDKIDNKIYSSLNYLKTNFNVYMNESNNEYINQKVVKDNIESLYNFHLLLILKLDILMKKRNELKNFYYSNLEKIKYVNMQRKQLNHLNLNSQYQKIKINLNSKCNNNIYKKQCQTHKKEFKIFQNIFNSYYFEYDILKYKESLLTKNMDIDDKLNLLISCVRASVYSYGNISQIYEDDEDSKIKLKALLFRYKIKEIEEENINNNNNKNYNIDKIKIIKEVDEEKEEDSEEEFEEQVDKKIKEIENKKLSSVKLIKISKNIFQFGTHKLSLILDKSEIKVDLGNNNLLTLEDFILKNKKYEEAIQKKSIKKKIF